MKKIFIPIILFMVSFDLKAQDYTIDNIEEYISNQKTFAVIPFTFRVNRKMEQSDF